MFCSSYESRCDFHTGRGGLSSISTVRYIYKFVLTVCLRYASLVLFSLGLPGELDENKLKLRRYRAIQKIWFSSANPHRFDPDLQKHRKDTSRQDCSTVRCFLFTYPQNFASFSVSNCYTTSQSVHAFEGGTAAHCSGLYYLQLFAPETAML